MSARDETVCRKYYGHNGECDGEGYPIQHDVAAVPPPGNRIAWILECGCEPMYEHCNQCDMRRVAVQEVKTREAWEQKAAELRTAGWQVTAP